MAPVALVCTLFALPLLLQGSRAHAQDGVTIYRCTDAQGRLTLRDTPCARGQDQQTREMTRPTDPPPRPAPPAEARAATPAPAALPPRVVVVHPPRPLYECTTLDGDTYTSDTGEGDPRWVPLWTLGYPAILGPGLIAPRIGGLEHRLPRADEGALGSHRRQRPRPGYPGIGYAYPAGTWVRDICHALPQQEVCDRLSDRRYELGRRYNSALQSERQRITIEQRGIDARLSTDCGAN